MKRLPRLVAVLLSALVAASGCRPEPPTSTRVEQWSQEQWPSKTPGAENSAVRQVVIPAAVSSADAPLVPLRLTTEATEVSPPSIIDPTRVEAGGFPERLLTEAEARRAELRTIFLRDVPALWVRDSLPPQPAIARAAAH